jgi:hypothetical protein
VLDERALQRQHANGQIGEPIRFSHRHQLPSDLDAVYVLLPTG